MTSVRRVAVRVSGKVARHVRRGHPWVFAESVQSVSPEGTTGDLAVVFDERREFAGIGLFDATSPIRVRVLHHGRPTPIDAAFFRGRLADALARREELVRSSATTGYRLLHGENDGMAGLVVDRYADTWVVKLDTAAWFPHLPDVVGALCEVADPSSVVLRLSRRVARDAPGEAPTEGSLLAGRPVTGPVPFLENGLAFEADVLHGQKTGFFLDQRDNRDRVRSRAAGRAVLDVCSASGGFSVAAAAGGARLVHSVDASTGAIDAARRAMAANADRPHVAACRHEATVGDAGEVMAALAARGERFGIVVVDPPSMASRREQVEAALRTYRAWCGLALDLLEPGGTLVQCSCTSRVSSDALEEVVRSAVAGRGATLRSVTTTGHALDHPVSFPEGEYLSAVFARVDR